MYPVEHLPGQRCRVRSGFGLVVRMIGVALVGCGLWIGVTPVISNLANWTLGHVTASATLECVPGMLIGLVVGLPLLGVGWAMAFLKHSIEIDLAAACVTEVNDFLLWKSQKKISLRDVKSVLLESTLTHGKKRTRYYVKALIVTKSGNLTAVSEPARFEPEVREVARQLSEILGVMLEDTISDDS